MPNLNKLTPSCFKYYPFVTQAALDLTWGEGKKSDWVGFWWAAMGETAGLGVS